MAEPTLQGLESVHLPACLMEPGSPRSNRPNGLPANRPKANRLSGLPANRPRSSNCPASRLSGLLANHPRSKASRPSKKL